MVEEAAVATDGAGVVCEEASWVLGVTPDALAAFIGLEV